MYRLARIYGYEPQADEAGVFLDRLYPRGIARAEMEKLHWLKDLTPSTALRRWYHAMPELRFAEFVTRYRAELQSEAAQAAFAELRALAKTHRCVALLSAVRDIEHSHVAVLRAMVEDE